MFTSWMICRKKWSHTFPVTFTWCSMSTEVQTFLFIGNLCLYYFYTTKISILLLQKEFLQHRECADIGTTLSYDVFGEQGKHQEIVIIVLRIFSGKCSIVLPDLHILSIFSVSNISCGERHSPGAALQEKLSKYSARFMQQGSINYPVIRYWNFYPGFQEACCQGHHHMENEIRSNPECWNCFEKHKISVGMDLSIGM